MLTAYLVITVDCNTGAYGTVKLFADRAEAAEVAVAEAVEIGLCDPDRAVDEPWRPSELREAFTSGGNMTVSHTDWQVSLLVLDVLEAAVVRRESPAAILDRSKLASLRKKAARGEPVRSGDVLDVIGHAETLDGLLADLADDSHAAAEAMRLYRVLVTVASSLAMRDATTWVEYHDAYGEIQRLVAQALSRK